MLAAMSGIDSTVAGHVPQRVQPLVGRRDLGRLPEHGAAERSICARASREREIGAEPGNRLELVERPAGVAQPAARHHRHGDAAARDHRREQERHLVADAAGRVLVDHGDRRSRRSGAGRPSRSSRRSARPARPASRPRQNTAMSSASHLIVRHPARRVLRGSAPPLLRRERPPVALVLDERRDHHSEPPFTGDCLLPHVESRPCGARSLLAARLVRRPARPDRRGPRRAWASRRCRRTISDRRSPITRPRWRSTRSTTRPTGARPSPCSTRASRSPTA